MTRSVSISPAGRFLALAIVIAVATVGALAVANWRTAAAADEVRCTATVVQLSADLDSEDVGLVGENCELRPFANSAADEYSPALSPDGERVAYVRGGEATELIVASVEGSDEHVVLRSDVLVGHPAWSPDGQRLAYWRGDGLDRPAIWVLDLESGSQTRLTDSSTVSVHPTWAPSGDELAFTEASPDGSRIVIVSSDGTDRTYVSPSGTAYKLPSWSPDGSHIAAVRDEDGETPMHESSSLVALNTVSGEVTRSSAPLDGKALATTWTDEGITLLMPGGYGVAKALLYEENLDEVLETTRYVGVPNLGR